MKLILSGFVALLLCSGFAEAQETNTYVSPTFQDILSRVIKRDKDSGAILMVKPKSDSSIPDLNLFFSITPTRRANETEITLKYNNMANNGIYEKYRLRTDNAMREEIKRLALYQQNLADAAQKREAQFAIEIEQRTSGTLSYGMTVEEVKQAIGKPSIEERIPTQRLIWDHELQGNINLIYPDMILHFISGKLYRLVDIPKSGIKDIVLHKGTGDKTLTPKQFKDLMQTAIPMTQSELAHQSMPGGYWYEGSFQTSHGKYTFTLGLGGVNYLRPSGAEGAYFKFTEKQ